MRFTSMHCKCCVALYCTNPQSSTHTPVRHQNTREVKKKVRFDRTLQLITISSHTRVVLILRRLKPYPGKHLNISYSYTDRIGLEPCSCGWCSLTQVRVYLWWSLCPLYLLACQARVTVGDSGLCCCVCVTSFER